MNFFSKAISKVFGGNKYDKDIKALEPQVELAKAEYAKLSGLSHDQLRAKTAEFKGRIAEALKTVDTEIQSIRDEIAANSDMDVELKDEKYKRIDELITERDKQGEVILEELLPEAFAVVKETARRFKENETLEVSATELDRELSVDRENIEIQGEKCLWHNRWIAGGSEIVWDMLHYDVQLIGGIVLHKGIIAEMATGEGKTLVATLPAYLNALLEQGVHIVTVNNYLAVRDQEWMAPIFQFLGITTDCIDKYKPHSPERRAAYNCDITYGTNNEFGFDYLRDNMVRHSDEMVQRKHHYAMIDEVDSVLIDDARTPLIISGPVAQTKDQEFNAFKPRVVRLMDKQRKLTQQFLVDAKKMIAEGDTEKGGVALLRAHRGLPKSKPLIKYLSEPGMRQILVKTENIYLADNARRMPEIDEELYFVIDEKQNSIDLVEKGIELITAQGEDPNFFVMPDVGAEMAEIEREYEDGEEKVEAKDQLLTDFAIKSERLHAMQQLLKAYALFEKDDEYVVVDGKVKIVDESTGRIMDGRRYSDGLHQAIEAKESVKVEAATQTHATITLQNFFRMYHKLAGMTGTAETEAGEFWEIYKLDCTVIPTNRPIARADNEDLVFKTTREKYNAVIDEIGELTEAGRPVLVGTTSVEISELLSRMLKMRGIKHNVLNAKQHAREADIVAEAGRPGAVTIATNMAGRGTDIKLGPGVKDAGGLAILGTARHDSRRVDRQLRGRSGRQGDPGSSVFYVSLEDELMRLFGSERVAKVMDRMGYKEGEVIQHSMITKSIERAQKKVEENNFGIRKHLLEYDDVMNSQRELIYTKRRNAVRGQRLSVDLNNSFLDLCDEVIEEHKGSGDFDAFKTDALRYFAIETSIKEEELNTESADGLGDKLYRESREAYERKSDKLASMAYPLIKDLYESRGETLVNVMVPFTDGRKTLHIPANLKEAYESEGKSIIRAFEKSLTLALIDEAWKEHLRQMDDLRQSVRNAQYEQKDPLLIYKFEAYNLFKEMISELNKDIASFLYKGSIPIRSSSEVKQAGERKRTDMSRMRANQPSAQPAMAGAGGGDGAMPQQEERRVEPVRRGKKIGRNEPCPCGSGKKYKHCHGQAGPA